MIRLQYIPSVLLVHRVPVINPVFDITIVSSRSVLYLVELSKKNHLYCVQKKSIYSLCPFHSSILSVRMAENNQVQVCDDVLEKWEVICQKLWNIDVEKCLQCDLILSPWLTNVALQIAPSFDRRFNSPHAVIIMALWWKESVKSKPILNLVLLSSQ